MKILYTDNDLFVCAWLRKLITEKQLLPGDVIHSDIKDLPDLSEYDQVHHFCGIGGWPFAFQMIGLQTNMKIWTGSCPCQPFSIAGSNKGIKDDRHVWPSFGRLIEKHRPAIVFGEQVSNKEGLKWFAGVRDDLERADYAVGATDLPACAIGAPHVRRRLWWAAFTMGDADHKGQIDYDETSEKSRDNFHGSTRYTGERHPRDIYSESNLGTLAKPGGDGFSKQQEFEANDMSRQADKFERSSQRFNSWDDSRQFVKLSDKRWRRTPSEPGLLPLAHGVPERLGQLRGYGNAIVPQVAKEFIIATIEAWNEIHS